MKLKNVFLGSITSLTIMIGLTNHIDADPIHEAAKNADIEAVKNLTNDGNVDSVDTYGNTALMIAARHGFTDIVVTLLKKGANINATNISRDTALMCAAYHGYPITVQTLLDYGANINPININGDTALIATLQQLTTARECEHSEVVRILLAHHADVNHANHQGETALIKCVSYSSYYDKSIKNYRHIEAVKRLLNSNAGVNHADNNGKTPLMTAVAGGNLEIAELLLDNGADMNTTDNLGRTVTYYAENPRHYVENIFDEHKVYQRSIIHYVTPQSIREKMLQLISRQMNRFFKTKSARNTV